LKKMK